MWLSVIIPYNLSYCMNQDIPSSKESMSTCETDGQTASLSTRNF